MITPANAKGEVRWGANKAVKEEGRKDVDGSKTGFLSETEVEKVVDKQTPDAPRCTKVIESFGERFRELLGGI